MKIGFIGTGSMVEALAAKWCQRHKLFFGGRNVEKAKLLAGRDSNTVLQLIQPEKQPVR